MCRISSHEPPRQRPNHTIVDPLTVAFGVAVARRRRAMGLTWRKLGTRCGVSANTIRNVERGTGSSRLDIVGRVAQGLGTPLSRLIREAEQSHPWRCVSHNTSGSKEPIEYINRGYVKAGCIGVAVVFIFGRWLASLALSALVLSVWMA